MKHSTIFYFCLMLSMGLYGIDNPDMGVSDLNVTHYAGKPSTPILAGTATSSITNKLEGVSYDDETGAQLDINVSIQPFDPKPTIVRVRYVSSPWLLYQGEESYDVRFLPTPTKWTGHGKTGFVVDDDISSSKSKRLEW